MEHQSLGRWGETQAANYLSSHGYRIIAQNFRTPYGEIDIIAQGPDLTIFVEVKTRQSPSLGPPEIAITPKKRAHLKACAEYYIADHPECDTAWRIDVLAVQKTISGAGYSIQHFQNVDT
jgi:putative endonuclease